MCERDRERVSEWETVCVREVVCGYAREMYVSVRKRQFVQKRERERECVCV